MNIFTFTLRAIRNVHHIRSVPNWRNKLTTLIELQYFQPVAAALAAGASEEELSKIRYNWTSWTRLLAERRTGGLCSWMDNDAQRDVLRDLFPQWIHFTGRLLYPIPCDPGEVYVSWEGAVGIRRYELLVHCIRTLQQELGLVD